MTSHINRAALLALLVVGVSACGGGGGKDSSTQPPTTPPVAAPAPTPPPAAPPTSIASRLGAAFAAIFGTSASAEPKDPAPGDLTAVNATAEPENF